MPERCKHCGGECERVGEQRQGPDDRLRAYQCRSCGEYGRLRVRQGRRERSGCLAGPSDSAPDGGQADA